MALNPFFLQGSPSEQRLVQELINEHLKIYGVEVIYIPRKFVRRETIIREISTSKFDDNFAIEAYVNSYEGHTGQGDILSKFGMNLKDELSLIISKERFEDFISPFLGTLSDDEIGISHRPKEGDIIYFPLGQRIFEVKFVEHEQPFYQLGKLYVYELKCELFEYEDEMGGWDNINTTVEEIDTTLENSGYITSLQLISRGSVATATPVISTGYVREIFLNNDGYDYTSTPTVAITTAPSGGFNASAVAITTSRAGVYSIQSIQITNAGAGYTIAPTITITGGGGSGAAATCSIETSLSGISSFAITNNGSGYVNSPIVSITGPDEGVSASAIAVVKSGSIDSIRILNPGSGYLAPPIVTIQNPPIITGIGTFIFNEVVTGSNSKATARVKTWNKDASILKVGTTDGDFSPGDIIVGSASSAIYTLQNIEKARFADKYEDNDQIEKEADLIVDFSESNPFGNY